MFDCFEANPKQSSLRKFYDTSQCDHRIGVIAWRSNTVFTAGACNDSLSHFRTSHVGSFAFATCTASGGSEVCGMAYSGNGLLATGHVDHTIRIWDSRTPARLLRTLSGHMATVRAIAFSPTDFNVLASGGGKADCTIRLWNAVTGQERQLCRTHAQVTELVFSPNGKEILASHGFSSTNLTLWNVLKLKQLTQMNKHGNGSVAVAASTDGRTVVSFGGDYDEETVRYWELGWKPQPKCESGFELMQLR